MYPGKNLLLRFALRMRNGYFCLFVTFLSVIFIERRVQSRKEMKNGEEKAISEKLLNSFH